MRGLIYGLFILVGLLECSHIAWAQQDTRRSVYKIRVTTQDLNFLRPWTFGSSESSAGTGFYIGNGRIMTNAHVVAGARYITVQRDGDAEPRPAKVQFIAHDSDLALLTLDDPSAFKKVRPLKFGSVPRLRSTVSTVGYPMGGEQISFTQGVVSRISFRTYVHTGYHQHLLVQVDSAINPGNSGGPVVQDNLVVGVAFQAFTQAENTGYIIPTPVINRFLKDVEDGRYDGHPEDGVFVRRWAVTNPSTAKFHGLSGEPKGVKVNEVASWVPAFGRILPDDILLEIEGAPIGVDGRIEYMGERIDFWILYDLRLHGDTVNYKVMRNGRIIDVPVQITPTKPHYMGQRIYARYPRYFVYGGLIFTALTQSYLQTWGSSWYEKAPLQLRYADDAALQDPTLRTMEDIVVIAGRLPHDVNNWAAGFEHQIVTSVDGKPIRSLRDAYEQLTKGSEELAQVRFLGDTDILVLDRNAVKGAAETIAKNYDLKQDSWFEGTEVDGASYQSGPPASGETP